jgi:serine/threonine protein kinase
MRPNYLAFAMPAGRRFIPTGAPMSMDLAPMSRSDSSSFMSTSQPSLGSSRSRVSSTLAAPWATQTQTQSIAWPTDASQIDDVTWGSLTPEERAVLVTNLQFTYHPEDYFDGKELGRGSFGVTRVIADRKSGKKFVLKSLAKDKTDAAALLNEVKILKKLQPICDGTTLCLEGYQPAGPTSNDHKIITNLLKGQDLSKYITNTPDEVRWANASQVLNNMVSDIAVIHRMGIAHRDIKPTNLSINPLSLKIEVFDFGLSCLKEECASFGIGGSPLYMPPEINFESPPVDPVTFDQYRYADLWAAGVTMLEYILGDRQFSFLVDVMGYPMAELMPHLPEEFTSEYPEVVSRIQKLLDLDPANRSLTI